MLSDRKKEILKAVVDDYIQTAEPVGSRAVVNRMSSVVSSATIRNEMADLESLGYLEQPHTSAGRVPSDKGYRMYVDELMDSYSLTVSDVAQINRALSFKISELDRLISEAGRMISELTHHPAISVTPSMKKEKIRRFEVIAVDDHTVVLVLVTSSDLIKNKICRLSFPLGSFEIAAATRALNAHFTDIALENMSEGAIARAEFETGAQISEIIIAALDFAEEIIRQAANSRIQLSGASKLLSFPEFRNIDKARNLLDFLSEEASTDILDIGDAPSGVKITIGDEHKAGPLGEASIIVAPYKTDRGARGMIGVVGPMRMDYAAISARLSRFADGLNEYFNKRGT